jgi:transglutaminase-like putative cysteine protease
LKAHWWSDTSRANWVDHGLSWLASVLAAFSCGQAVLNDTVSWISVLIVTIGALLSFLMSQTLRGKKFLKIDGPLYCIFAWVAILGVRALTNGTFGPEAFPPELRPSSWLLWMVIFGSFFTWRDGTLLFHAIPALAMFGFVGCYDTFSGVVGLFFIFLLCFAMLFSRAHARDMQQRAVESGYFAERKQVNLNPEDQSVVLREGPWRWAAGAEWALGSALIIVVLSLLGAPVIQATAKPISGIVRVNVPKLPSRATSPVTSVSQTPRETTIGNGPINLSDTPQYEVRGDFPLLLRVATFSTWRGHSWTKDWQPGYSVYNRKSLSEATDMSSEQRKQFFEEPIIDPANAKRERKSRYIVRALGSTVEIPQAGNSPYIEVSRQIVKEGTNTISLAIAERFNLQVSFNEAKGLPKNSPPVVSDLLRQAMDVSKVPIAVSKLAKDVTKGLATDIERAEAISREVSRRIKYNTQVEAVPLEKDPSEVALFETKEGYCDVFATSVVNMARSVEIPARYVVGYAVDPGQRSGMGTQYLLESDRHAWAELFFEGVGWVPFDATAAAEVVPGGGRRDKSESIFTLRNILLTLLNLLIVAAIFAGGWFYFRNRNRAQTPDSLRTDYEREYMRFTNAIRTATGKRRLLSETTSEYLQRVEDQLTGVLPLANAIGTEFTNVMFQPEGVSQIDVEKIKTSVDEFSLQLRKLSKSR